MKYAAGGLADGITFTDPPTPHFLREGLTIFEPNYTPIA